ncbi:type 1 glutamine amidotransferase domain-containing protein [Niabella yanshanensis]|uniref:Type 1 glutamine amidotransferase domain-containing protein n=1 Tax=Niabella yanshanensis TaxID=577386 RepID=A0ABZ0W9X3_9BACT|nr:type 1 glutamine amidotransferase domain-containing protein [Niabella yanshanensis]WQD40100.1 type 1 glutamine amidotransferase domain-containing protein [Niabella yanshanensis]
MKHILMVLTSHSAMENTDSTTGLWLGEFTDPYYGFIDAGYRVTIASPLGGKPPIDPLSLLTENITASNRRFNDDKAAQSALDATLVLDTINATDFDAVFYPGGHGPLWDLADDEYNGRLILEFIKSRKPVGAVCHGPAALIKAAELAPGLLSGTRITAFTNTEETLTLRADNIPYHLETRLKKLGADFKSAVLPFTNHVETDGLFVTGQNPLSAGPAARALIALLKKGTIKD